LFSLTPRWSSMGYPMKKDIKIRLIFLYYEIICEPEESDRQH
jgi:hypothetical protein